MLIVFFLSIYMVVDRDAIMAFLFRIVPPTYADEARLLQTSVSRSFGGFLRGQAVMGLVYFFIALGTNLLMGLPLAALTSTASGILQAIPFFGPFLSWAPPVIVALLFKPDAAPPDVHPDDHRLGRRDEHPPAADHAGGRRHPSDRRPRLGADRVAARGRRGRDLRHPDRGRRLGLLLPLPPSHDRRPDRGRASRPAAERTRRPTGPRAARTDARERRRHRRRRARRSTPAARRAPPRDRRRHAGPDPRAGPDRAARPRQGTWRAGRRRRGARRAAGPPGPCPAAG